MVALAAVVGDSYTAAPACEMLATHCCVCGLPLLDALSVELGIGPICRKKYGFDAPIGIVQWESFDATFEQVNGEYPLKVHAAARKRDARVAANGVVHRLALRRGGQLRQGQLDVPNALGLLICLGFVKLAMIVADAMVAVRIEIAGDAVHLPNGILMNAGHYEVRVPFSDDFRAKMWAGGGLARVGVWDKRAKCYRVSHAHRGALFAALKLCYTGQDAVGPKGKFVL